MSDSDDKDDADKKKKVKISIDGHVQAEGVVYAEEAENVSVGREGDVISRHIVGSVNLVENPEDVARIKAKAKKAKQKIKDMKAKMKKKFGK